MNLKFVQGSVHRSVDSIMEFTRSGQNEFWAGPFFHFYPDIDRAAYTALDDPAKRTFLMDYFTEFESANRGSLREKLNKYNARWQEYSAQITAALEDAFAIPLTGIFDDLTCHVTFSPISPRYLERHEFDSFYMESEQGALGTALHEIIHFIWFHVWRSHFRDDPAEYETPNLKWILSEMAVEPIMRDPRLGGINPYFVHKQCVYPYFYTMTIDGAPILDTLNRMRASLAPTRFMEEALKYCALHEHEIRAHINAPQTLDTRRTPTYNLCAAVRVRG